MGKPPWQTPEGSLLDRIWIIPNGCWQMKQGLTKKGYGQVNIGGKIRRANRVAYELWVGLVPDDMFVCHSCDNRACIRPDHLFLGTAQENTDDMMSKGRVQKPRKPCEHGLSTWACAPCKKEYNRNYYLNQKAGN